MDLNGVAAGNEHELTESTLLHTTPLEGHTHLHCPQNLNNKNQKPSSDSLSG